MIGRLVEEEDVGLAGKRAGPVRAAVAGRWRAGRRARTAGRGRTVRAPAVLRRARPAPPAAPGHRRPAGSRAVCRARGPAGGNRSGPGGRPAPGRRRVRPARTRSRVLLPAPLPPVTSRCSPARTVRPTGPSLPATETRAASSTVPVRGAARRTGSKRNGSGGADGVGQQSGAAVPRRCARVRPVSAAPGPRPGCTRACRRPSSVRPGATRRALPAMASRSRSASSHQRS